jgi:hypothetical protein
MTFFFRSILWTQCFVSHCPTDSDKIDFSCGFSILQLKSGIRIFENLSKSESSTFKISKYLSMINRKPSVTSKHQNRLTEIVTGQFFGELIRSATAIIQIQLIQA